MSTIAWDILWRDHGAQKGMENLSRAAKDTSANYGKFKAAAAVGLLALGAAAVKFGKDSVAAYSDAQSQQAKLAFAFEKFPKLADTNQKALQNLNSALQLKTKYDDDAIASGQSVLAQFHLTGQQLTQITPLLLDFASKTGRDLPTAARLLGQSFLGNSKALRQIGVNYKATGDEATDFANITGILRQQVGGLAEKEGKTAAGQLAILKNQFGELQETAGQKLLPAVIAITGGLTNMAQFVGNNSKVIIPLVVGVGGLAAVIWTAQKAQKAWAITQELSSGLAGKAVGGLNLLKTAFTGVELTSAAAGRAMRIAQLSIPLVGVALFAVTTAMTAFAAKGDDGTQTTNDFASAMESVEGQITRVTTALNKNVRAQAVSSLQAKGAYDQAKLLGISYQDVTDAALGNTDAIGRVNAALGDALALNPGISKANSDQRNAAIALSQSMGGVAHESLAAADAERVRRAATEQAIPPVDAYKVAQDNLKGASKALRTELRKVIDNLTILKHGALDQEEANLNWQESLDNLRASVKENGKSLSENTDKGRANRRAIIDSMKALDDKTKADYKNAGQQKNSTKATADANKRYQENKRDLEKAAVAAGYSSGEVKKMIKQYLKTPDQLKTEIVAKTAAANKKVDDYQANLKKTPKGINTFANVFFKNNAGRVVANLNKQFQLVKGGPRMTLATGGVLPGYTPGRDVHWFSSATGGVLGLSGGEAIMRPEWTRAVGGPKAVARMNAEARSGRTPLAYAGGGVYGASQNAQSREATNGTMMYAWGVARKLEGAIKYAKEHGGGSAGLGDPAHVSNPRAVTSYHGGRFTRLFVANLKAAERDAGRNFSIYQGGFRPTTSYSGSTHNMDAIDAHVNYALLRSFRRHVGAMGDRTGLGNWASHMHGVPAPGHGYGSPSARAQYRDYVRRGGARQGMRSPWGLDAGGVMLDPSSVNVAERGPERVLTTRQSAAFENLSRSLARTGGEVKVEYHVHAPNYVGTPQDLIRALTKAEQGGQLDALKRKFKS